VTECDRSDSDIKKCLTARGFTKDAQKLSEDPKKLNGSCELVDFYLPTVSDE